MNAIASQPALSLRGAKKAFGNNVAVEDVTFAAADGERIAIYGPNGSGKSTTLNLISGFYDVDSGECAWRSGIRFARCYQTPRVFPSLSAIDNVCVALAASKSIPSEIYGWRQPAVTLIAEGNRILDRFSLYRCRKTSADKLSYAERRFLEVARACATSPNALLLDEPFAALSQADADRLCSLILGWHSEVPRRLVICVEHNREMASRLCSRWLEFEAGKCVYDSSI